MYKVSGLFIYPIKSLGGIEVTQVNLCNTGFEYDRRWMLVDENNQFLSQRNFPLLALCKVSLVENGFLIRYQNQELVIPFFIKEGEFVNVKIWDDEVKAIKAEEKCNQFFSSIFNQHIRLVYLPDNSHRQIDLKYAQPNESVSFADGYPILVIGESSLELLNSKLTEPLPMNRFRPNLVFSGGLPHDEDTWKTFMVSDAEFLGVKPCGRCTVTTINQQTGEKGAEPLKTLSTYRSKENKILFGQNVIAKTLGKIKVGDIIKL